jgi:hypothetical protein
MGYRWIGVCASEGLGSELSAESHTRLQETAVELKRRFSLPDVIYCDGSKDGRTMAQELARLLEVPSVLCHRAFEKAGVLNPLQRMEDALEEIADEGCPADIVVCPAARLHEYLRDGAERNRKLAEVEELLPLASGECFVFVFHPPDWKFDASATFIFPSRDRAIKLLP